MKVVQSLETLFLTAGDMGIFAMRAARDAFRSPFELNETVNQLFQVGVRSVSLVAGAGVAFGLALALQTRASMANFGAEALIPSAVSFGLIKDIGPVVTSLLVSGRVGAGIGAELAGMRVTTQIDALEALAVNSFKYLVVTRMVACIIAVPFLTVILDFGGLFGGMVSEMVAAHMAPREFFSDAFSMMGWSDYIPATLKTIVFGVIIGTVSCYLGYTASQGAAGVGRASTRSVVISSLLVIFSDVILVKLILFWFNG